MTKKFITEHILKFRSSLYKGLRVEGRASLLKHKISKENQTNLSETKQTILKAIHKKIKANTKIIFPPIQSKARVKRFAVQRKVKLEKYLSALLTVIILAMSFCAVSASADEDIIKIGDEVSLVFNIANVENVAGVSVEAAYNSEYLLAENIVCNVSGSESNIATPGEVKWNFLVYDGMDFDNTDVITVTFKAVKSCKFSDTDMKYNCREFFNPDLQKISDDPNSFFNVLAVHNNTKHTVYTIGSAESIEPETNTIDSNINEKDNTSKLLINKNTDNISSNSSKTENTESASDTDTVSRNRESSAADKSTNILKTVTNDSTVVTGSNLSDNQTVQPQSTNTTSAVNTSGEQYLTVILLLLIMVLSGVVSVMMNK